MTADLAARIERAYQKQTGAPSGLGAQLWFAEQTGSNPRTVRRWMTGEYEPRRPVLRVLEMLEQDPS